MARDLQLAAAVFDRRSVWRNRMSVVTALHVAHLGGGLGAAERIVRLCCIRRVWPNLKRYHKPQRGRNRKGQQGPSPPDRLQSLDRFILVRNGRGKPLSVASGL